MKWVRKGADVGDPSSQYRMAFYLLYGNEKESGVARNPAEAQRLAMAAADNMKRSTDSAHVNNPGWAEGARQLAARAETIARLQPLAEKGDAEAMWGLSQAYVPLALFGMGTAGNTNDQEQWLKKAAEAGQPQALTAMANRASTPQERLAWQQKAAAGGTADAMLQLANNHRASGDEKTALEWYRKAAAKGSEPARKAVLQLTDATVLRLQATAASGDAEAMFELGEYFRAGNWAGKDSGIAQQWYLKAAAKNHVNASYQAALGNVQPAEKDKLMRAAANGGNADAAKWVAGEERRLAAKRQQSIADQNAFVARIDREGTIDSYEAEVYCRFGGRRCDEMRRAARVALERNNAAAEAANMRRIQNLYSDGKSADQRNQEYLDRSKCLQNNTQVIQNNTYGKTDWSYKDCK